MARVLAIILRETATENAFAGRRCIMRIRQAGDYDKLLPDIAPWLTLL